MLTPTSKVFMDAVCPYLHVPMFKFFGNVEPAQKADIQANAATVLAIVVHGGGQHFITRSLEKAAGIKSFIQSPKLLPPPKERPCPGTLVALPLPKRMTCPCAMTGQRTANYDPMGTLMAQNR